MKRPLALSGALLMASSPGWSEITLDGTLGPPGAQAGDMVVLESMGARRGSNLFHSFGVLNVNQGETLTFLAQAPTSNLISRVTGGTPSLINGLLSTSQIPGASFWLVNPAGLMIGAEGVIDVAGSFNGSSADEVVFADGSRFSASDISASSLTIADPIGFGFLDANIAPVTVTGSTLDVPGGLNLVGGDVTVADSTINTAGSRFGFAAAASDGVVTLDADGFGFQGVAVRGGVTQSASFVETEGGAIFIKARDFLMDGESDLFSITDRPAGGAGVAIDVDTLRLAEASQIQTQTLGSGDAGAIEINAAESMTIDDGNIQSFSAEGATGATGDITVNTGEYFQRLSFMGVFTLGEGLGGTLTVNATDSIRLEGGFGTTFASNSLSPQQAGDVFVTTPDLSFDGGSILARALGTGDGGSVNLTVGSLTMTNGTQLSVGAFNGGTSGNVNIVADTIFMTGDIGFPTGIFASSSVGPAGNVSILTRTLELEDGAEIFNGTFGPGDAGGLDIVATERISIRGRPEQVDVERFVFTGIFSNTFGTGDAGDLNIVTPLLELSSSGSVQASSFQAEGGGAGGSISIEADTVNVRGGHGPGVLQGSFISAIAFGDGTAGDIAILADEIDVAGEADSFDGVFARATSSGDAGNVVIDAGSLRVGSYATVDASTLASGDAGSLVIAAGDVTVTDGGAIAVSAVGPGSAGSITMDVAGELRVEGVDPAGAESSRIESSSLSSEAGSAGDLTIAAGTLTLADGGQISAITESDRAANTPAEISLSIQGDSVLSGASTGDEIPAGIFAQTAGAADAGSIQLTTGTLTIADAATIGSGTSSSGDGGSIEISSPRILLTSGGLITSTSSGSGFAGDVALSGEALVMEDGAALTTNAENSAGGNVDLTFVDIVQLVDSSIDAAANGVTPQSNGGNISIDPEFVVLNRSELLARANAGNGGNILIRADYIFPDAESTVDASSRTGVDGEVRFESPNELADTVIEIETPGFEGVEVVRNACGAQAAGGRTSLVVETVIDDGIRPDGFLPTPQPRLAQQVAAVECVP